MDQMLYYFSPHTPYNSYFLLCKLPKEACCGLRCPNLSTTLQFTLVLLINKAPIAQLNLCDLMQFAEQTDRRILSDHVSLFFTFH